MPQVRRPCLLLPLPCNPNHAVCAAPSLPHGVNQRRTARAAVGNLPETKCKSLQLEISCKSTLCVATASFQTGFGQEVKLYTRSRWTAEGSVMVRTRPALRQFSHHPAIL